MDDLISRQKMLQTYYDLCVNILCIECPFHFGDAVTGDCLFEKWIKDLPSVESERKTGKWINIHISVTGDFDAECDQCGAVVHNNFSTTVNFCPNCGAELRQAKPQTVTGLDGTVYVQDEDKQGWTGHQMMRGDEE